PRPSPRSEAQWENPRPSPRSEAQWGGVGEGPRAKRAELSPAEDSLAVSSAGGRRLRSHLPLRLPEADDYVLTYPFVCRRQTTTLARPSTSSAAELGSGTASTAARGPAS